MMSPVNTQSGEHYVWGAACDGWHLLKRDDLSIIQERVPPKASETKHFHHKARQFFYILRGQATMIIGDEKFVLNASDGIEIAPEIVHQMRNETDEDLHFLVISAPKSHGDRENLNIDSSKNVNESMDQ
ncbi:MAG: cupin domain-containing protein [Pyrinomonadaceae bacterium]